MTRNSIALMRDGSVMADSDLVDFLSGPTDSAINFNGSADSHTPIHPPPTKTGYKKTCMREKAEPQIYTFIALKTRIEITPSTPAKCCKHLTNHRKSPNFKSDSQY